DDPLSPGRGGPRIIPTPKPPRSKLVPGILVGLLAGLVLFGSAGYVVGTKRAPKAPAAPQQPGPPAGNGTLGVYEQTQLAVNREKFTGDLRTFAESWLPYVASCVRNGQPYGPQLGDGETVRIACQYGSVNVNFVQFVSTQERDKARERHMLQHYDATKLLPGVAGPATKRSTSGHAEGNYIEYGFKLEDGRLFAGVWWDDTKSPVSGFLVANWNDGLDQKWEPMRDVWQRYS
ncbi:hypothetical protein GSF22_26110, partial [Micromonospora echinofusca]|nr:hypothetical protein [Micromonospora echinofusca]